MSVWDDPCYSIEPLRNATNNLPRYSLRYFPEILQGIADFAFGDCGDYHPARSGRNAAEYYLSDPGAWQDFVRAKPTRGDIDHQQAFLSTLEVCNVKYAGIRSVYWAYKKFATHEWSLDSKLSFSDTRSAVRGAFSLGGAASRIEGGNWQKYFDTVWPESETHAAWFKYEQLADSINKIWTINRERSYKRKRKELFAFFAKHRTIKERRAVLGDESIRSTINVKSDWAGNFDAKGTQDQDEAAVSRHAIRERIVTGLPVSKADARKATTFPMVSFPKAGGRLGVFRFEGGYILYDKVERVGGIMFHKDHSRLVNMIKAKARLELYYANYDADDPELCDTMISKYHELENMFLNNMKSPTDNWCNKVCRAYDVAQFAYLASIADDLTDRSYVDQLAKFKRENLSEVLDLDKLLYIVDDVGVKEALELLKFYKIFPCPDFDIYSTVAMLKRKAANKNKATWRTTLVNKKGKQVTTSRSEFKLYMMRNRLITYWDMFGRLPGKLRDEASLPDGMKIPNHLISYPEIRPEIIQVGDMRFIDIHDTYSYVRYNDMEYLLVKDKTTAMKSAKDRESDDPPAYARNQVLQYLFDRTFKSQEEVNNMFRQGGKELDEILEIELAIKPEAKKKDPRVFAMATDPARRQLSEFESNVARYVVNQRGSSQGKASDKLSQSLDELASTPVGGRATLMMSFDLEGFSTSQDPDFKKIGYEVWSDVFGQDDIMPILDIFNKGRLRFSKFDVDDTLNLDGDDLEGFNGRLNTATHADLMGYAVHKLRELGIVKQSAKLEVLIDDGLLRLDFEALRGDDTWQWAIENIDRVYKAAGLKISWDKTFTSSVMCQYLNRVYYDGCEVTPGAKAFLRIGKRDRCAVPTLVDELLGVAATVRGAIQSGSDHRLAYLAYCLECTLRIREWSGYRNDLGTSSIFHFMMFVPVNLGGLGLLSLYSLSTNEGYTSLIDSVSNMKMICHCYPEFAPVANSVLNVGMRYMDAEGILKNVFSIKTKARCLNSHRFPNAAKDKVMRKVVNPFIVSLIAASRVTLDDTAVATIENANVVNEVQRSKLYDMSPISVFDTVLGKLQSSGTAARLLGNAKCAIILMINKREANQIIGNLMKGILSRSIS